MEISFDNGRARAPVLELMSARLLPAVQQVRQVLEAGRYSAPEASVNLPGDSEIIAQVAQVVQQVDTVQLRYVFLVGIGGSYLGAKAVYDALFSMRDMVPHTQTRLVCLDTNNPALLASIQQIIATLRTPEEYFVVIASKSGTTTETMANAEVLIELLDTRWPKRAERICVVSDDASPLLAAGQALGMHSLALPKQVGGRYSVFSAVGLLPLMLCGVDCSALVAGAEAMLESGTHQDPTLNPASASAAVRVHEYTNGKVIHDWFVFRGELASLGGWWRQLVGESIGKSVGAVRYGITPTVSIGSNDLHSVGQLYLGGPTDKFITFVTVKSRRATYTVPTARVFPSLVPMVTGVAVEDITEAIVVGTKEACLKRSIPFMTITFEAITPYELGAFMQFAMLETIYVGRLLGVNPFDQPDVEAYKTITKDLLEQKRSHTIQQ